MFKLAIELCFENHFGLIHAKFLSLGSTKSVYFFWDTRYKFCKASIGLDILLRVFRVLA